MTDLTRTVYEAYKALDEIIPDPEPVDWRDLRLEAPTHQTGILSLPMSPVTQGTHRIPMDAIVTHDDDTEQQRFDDFWEQG